MNIVLRYAPNLAGSFYVTGNLLMLVLGGISGNIWQAAAAILWLFDGIILGWFGRSARGIETHAMVNLCGTFCFILSLSGLEDPWGQLIFAWLQVSTGMLKLAAPHADAPMQKPESFWRQPLYFALRHPLRTVSVIALCGRFFAIYGAIATQQWGFLASVLIWMGGDMFQFLSRKGGYKASLT